MSSGATGGYGRPSKDIAGWGGVQSVQAVCVSVLSQTAWHVGSSAGRKRPIISRLRMADTEDGFDDAFDLEQCDDGLLDTTEPTVEVDREVDPAGMRADSGPALLNPSLGDLLRMSSATFKPVRHVLRLMHSCSAQCTATTGNHHKDLCSRRQGHQAFEHCIYCLQSNPNRVFLQYRRRPHSWSQSTCDVSCLVCILCLDRISQYSPGIACRGVVSRGRMCCARGCHPG